MGTASLVFGIIVIGVGLYFLFIPIPSETGSDEELVDTLIAKLILVVPAFVIGGLLLRKFDKDRKKEKNS